MVSTSPQEFGKLFPQFRKRVFEVLELFQELLVHCKGFIVQLPIVGRGFHAQFAIMMLDRLFEIVDVDELNVKLVVEMFDFPELVFGEVRAYCLLEFGFVLGEFFPVLPECITPGTALPGELCNFYLNHGILILKVRQCGSLTVLSLGCGLLL